MVYTGHRVTSPTSLTLALTLTSSLAAPASPSSNQNPPARHGIGRPWRPCGVAICNPSYRQKETPATSPCHPLGSVETIPFLSINTARPRHSARCNRTKVSRKAVQEGGTLPWNVLADYQWLSGHKRDGLAALIGRAPEAQRLHFLLCSTVPQEIRRNPSQWPLDTEAP
ncbi:hypothetical protein LA080_003346 [Diaporthe eres]|nr:hypothetical protein LA080_003346 [Diaporthe eres]